MGGTPTLPSHAQMQNVFLSPGTLFVSDAGYPKASRISPWNWSQWCSSASFRIPRRGCSRWILAPGPFRPMPRGVLAGMEEKCEGVLGSEEHWVFRMKPGFEAERPAIGTVLFVILTHICPTTAMYDAADACAGGRIMDLWKVAARERMAEPPLRICCDAQEIDARGKNVFPAFIDIHRHMDAKPLLGSAMETELCQGIASAVAGNCGFSLALGGGAFGAEKRANDLPILGAYPPEWGFPFRNIWTGWKPTQQAYLRGVCICRNLLYPARGICRAAASTAGHGQTAGHPCPRRGQHAGGEHCRGAGNCARRTVSAGDQPFQILRHTQLEPGNSLRDRSD